MGRNLPNVLAILFVLSIIGIIFLWLGLRSAEPFWQGLYVNMAAGLVGAGITSLVVWFMLERQKEREEERYRENAHRFQDSTIDTSEKFVEIMSTQSKLYTGMSEILEMQSRTNDELASTMDVQAKTIEEQEKLVEKLLEVLKIMQPDAWRLDSDSTEQVQDSITQHVGMESNRKLDE